LFLFFFYGVGDHRDLPSFPTRRSSDLVDRSRQVGVTDHGIGRQDERAHPGPSFPARQFPELAHARSQARVWLTVHIADDTLNLSDRKSTRLNSSHVSISYAVFCLKKKN